MRAFLALDLSEEAVGELEGIKDQIKLTNRGKGTYTKPENYHMSLAFLDEITKDQAEILKRILQNSCTDVRPFDLSLNHLGYFSDESSATVWCSVNPDNNLKALVSDVYKAVRDARIHFDSKPFKAHITLGRKINIMNCQLNKIEVKPISFKVDGITLYKSVLLPDGPVYSPVYRIEF